MTRRYSLNDVSESLTNWAAPLDEAQKAQVVERFASTFVRAQKPSQ